MFSLSHDVSLFTSTTTTMTTTTTAHHHHSLNGDDDDDYDELWEHGKEATRAWKVATTNKTGPNDTSSVVWGLGEVFFLFLCFFLILTHVYCINRL
jgi:hypothetical protein